MSTETKRYVLRLTLSSAVIGGVITLTCGCEPIDAFLWDFLLDALIKLDTLPVVTG